MAEMTGPDWAKIESDYRNGGRSTREIARWHKVSEGAVRKRAKAGGWERPGQPEPAPKPALSEPVPVRAKAEKSAPAGKPDAHAIADRGLLLIDRMLDELDVVTANVGELQELIEISEEDPRRQLAMMKAIDLPSRANTAKTLAAALKTLMESKPQGAGADGKKAERDAAAKDVGAEGNPYAVRRAPKMIVDNTKK